MTRIGRHAFRFAAAFLGLAIGQTALADDYPSRPVKLIIPFAAGGPTDIVARVVTTKMTAAGFGQPIAIENRGGGGGSIGTEAAAKSPPDGYTLALGTTSTHGTNPWLYSRLPYHPVDSFVAIAQVGITPMILVVHPKVPANTIQEFIAYAKAHPGELNQSTSGVGVSGHILGAMLNKVAGIQTTMVPYAGAGPAVQDLLAGVTAWQIDGAPVMTPGIRAGKLRILATTMGRRAKAFPDTPTLAEAGYPQFDAYTWNVFYAPAGTPKPVADHIAKYVSLALADKEVIARLTDVGVEPTPDTTSESAAAFAKREYEKWGPFVKLSGAKVE